MREQLTENRTYYISVNGNDSNEGLHESDPLRTPQKAINKILYDLGWRGDLASTIIRAVCAYL